MLDVILVSNYSMKEELRTALENKDCELYDLLIQDVQHIERYPIDDEYKTIIIQSANAIKKIDSSNNHIYSAERVYGIGPNCKLWVERKFGIKCSVPDIDYSSKGLIDKIETDEYELGKTLLLKGIGGKNIIKEYLEKNKIQHKICDVYERILNKENLARVAEKSKAGIVIIGFSRSSIMPLINHSNVDLEKMHFFVLDKSDEDIIDKNAVNSLTKIEDIYDVELLAQKISQLNE